MAHRLGEELHDKTYEASPVRRVLIPEPGGGGRPLGIPAIRDRVAQTAAKLVWIVAKKWEVLTITIAYDPAGRSAVTWYTPL